MRFTKLGAAATSVALVTGAALAAAPQAQALATGHTGSGVPAVTTVGSTLYVAWTGSTGTADAKGLNLGFSTDGGQTITKVANGQTSPQGEGPALDNDGTGVFIAWPGSDTAHTLNYKIRVLGRRGVLVLNAVSAMNQLPLVQEATPAALAMVEFNPGNRYADFVKGKDHMAAYGVGALIIGGIAAKAGLFKFLIPILLAAKKLIIVAVAGVAAFFRRFFGGKRKTPTTPAA